MLGSGGLTWRLEAQGVPFDLFLTAVRLNSIKLSGFKSFAEPTNFVLPGQLVGVVGPNGCGKSNIMDACRWVLGESKASELRGESMQDVIFNGTNTRKAASRASVELVFDNADHRAGGQWGQFAEIAVKRVLTRDGNSSYFINNQPVRRRDVQDVFLGTGLGPRAYAIIGQGTISRIIESRPEELRLFLEEAAGVSKYKERRRETENRLSDTRENLTRVEDILRELNANLEKLEKQAEVAQRFNGLKADSTLKQQQLWFFKRADAETDQVKIKADVDKAMIDLESRIADLRHVESDLETVRQAHYAAGDQVNQAQGLLYEATAEVGRLEAEIRFVVEGRQRAEQRLTGPIDKYRRKPNLSHWQSKHCKLKTKPSPWPPKWKSKLRLCPTWKMPCAKRKPKPMSSALAWFKCSNKFRCWLPTSATSKIKRVS
jgi:chromosome segregation protein